MGRYASEKSGSGFTPAPAGTHLARCIRLCDLGTQHENYEGKPQVREKILVTWELPNELIEVDGLPKPQIVSQFYTNSLSEKSTLRAHLESWRARKFTPEELEAFDLMNLLGKACMVSITHTANGNAKVVGVSSLPKGMVCPPQVNESSAFWIDPWDDNAFAALPEGIKKIIANSDEYKDLHSTAKQKTSTSHAAGDLLEDDIPF